MNMHSFNGLKHSFGQTNAVKFRGLNTNISIWHRSRLLQMRKCKLKNKRHHRIGHIRVSKMMLQSTDKRLERSEEKCGGHQEKTAKWFDDSDTASTVDVLTEFWVCTQQERNGSLNFTLQAKKEDAFGGRYWVCYELHSFYYVAFVINTRRMNKKNPRKMLQKLKFSKSRHWTFWPICSWIFGSVFFFVSSF